MDSSLEAVRDGEPPRAEVPPYPTLAHLAWLKPPDGDAFVASDLRTGFRMAVGPDEREVCEFIDGTRSIDDIARDASIALQRPVTPAAIARFVAKLAQAGALQADHAASTLRTPLFSLEADAVSQRWARRLGPVLRLPGVLVMAVIAAAVAMAFAPHATEAGDLFPMRLTVALTLLLLLPASMVLHEVAHGVALRSVGEAVGAIRFDPAQPGHLLSIDVTRVYALRRRAHRAGVLLAGPAVHLAFASLGALLWMLVPPGGVAALGFGLAVMQYAMAALMLIPFVTSDGYYVLAALLDIPDMGRRARHLLRLVLRGPRWERDAQVAVLGARRTVALLLFALGWWLSRVAGTGAILWLVARQIG